MRSPIQLLSDAWVIYTANIKLLLGIFILPAIITLFATLWFGIDADPASFEAFMDDFFSPAFLLFALLLAIVNVLMGMALIKAIADPATVTLESAYRFALTRLIPYLVVSFISGVLIFLGFLLLIIPGVILLIWFLFSQLILLLEDKGPIEALRASREYVRGRWFKVAGRLAFLILVSLIISGIISFFSSLFGAVFGDLARSAVMQLGNFILVPLSISYLYLLYRDAQSDHASSVPVESNVQETAIGS